MINEFVYLKNKGKDMFLFNNVIYCINGLNYLIWEE